MDDLPLGKGYADDVTDQSNSTQDPVGSISSTGSPQHTAAGMESVPFPLPDKKIEQTETISSLETLKTPEKFSLADKSTGDKEKLHPDVIGNIASEQVKGVVIDKSHEPLTLHSVEKTGDKLTRDADEEEERFIEEVEKHHEHS